MRAVPPWIITNPIAGSGRALAAGQALLSRIPEARLVETQARGDATRIAREARRLGVDTVVAVGGDGTIHECALGLTLNEDSSVASHGTRLALLPAGTGGDFRRTYEMNDSLERAHARIVTPRPIKIDLGKIEFETREERRTSLFANVLTFGLGGLADQLVDKGPKWIGGKAAYLMGAVRATLAYQPLPIELTLDGKLIETAPYSNVAICLGRFVGGGMQMAPQADPSDGLFDVVTMELTKWETLSLTKHIYGGTHFSRRGVHHYRCRTLEARTTRPGECLIDVDGEQLGSLSLKAQVLPLALELLA